jgi:hypothetical protein
MALEPAQHLKGKKKVKECLCPVRGTPESPQDDEGHTSQTLTMEGWMRFSSPTAKMSLS